MNALALKQKMENIILAWANLGTLVEGTMKRS